MSVSLEVREHPLLDLGAFVTEFPQPLGALPSPQWLLDLLSLDAPAPVSRSEEMRKHVRDLLRHGGYKPTGRGKPASEYLVRAVGEGKLGSINLAVDTCNVVSLHSGLPISVVDLDRAKGALFTDIAAQDSEYVFNTGGQTIKVAGLLCLHDQEGPCANGVKDAQRTKTDNSTTRVLSLVWGTQAVAGHTEATVTWYRELLTRARAALHDIECF